ncbi:T9SS sorting signal type C domain-containing protein [Flavobacterium sp.]|uniref:T9SS sorting signal type C domain-containing protein n=1 Tax=Flavobacterium sp. TaxID=239 RepID=UPI003D0B2947
MKRILLTLQLVAFPLFFYAQTTVTFSSTGTTTFYVPAGVPSVTMNAWGGGGGGGGSTIPLLSLQRAAAGGGGGAFAGGTYTMPAGVNTNLSITVGAGGTAGAGSSNGAGGGSSLITSYVTAVGGGGGTANSNDGSPAAGAAGLASASTGQTKADGGAGGAGQTLLPAVAGSGGSGGNSGGVGGAGASGLLANANGIAGTQPGGGGGGSKSAVLGSVGTGGTGGAGRVTIAYTCPTYSLTNIAASVVDVCVGTSSTITLSGLPVGLYTVAYQLGGVTQTPVSMTVTTGGSGTFSVSGFTTLATTSLVVTSLTSGTSANAGDNCVSTLSSGNTVNITPISSGTAPVALAGTGATCTQITANWQAVSGTSYYVLDVSTDINFGSFLINSLNVGNVFTYNVTGLNNTTNYFYRVRAFSGTCISANSNTIAYKPAIAPGTVVFAASTSVVCTGFTANWTAVTNALTYQIQISTDNTFPATAVTQTFSGITATSYTFTGLNPGTIYYYRALARNGCADSAYGIPSPASTSTLTLPSAPTISASGSLSICQNGSVTLTSSVATNNVWSTGATTQSIIVAAAGSYTVKVVNAGGCTSSSSLPAVVTVSPLPTATAGGSATICSNGSATVTGATATNGTILWSFSGGSGTLTNATTLTPTYTPSLGGTARTVILTMTVTSNNSCSPQTATASYTINIQGAPTAASSGSQTICANGSATVSGASAANGTILWTHNGAGTLTNATTVTPTYNSATADAGNQVTLTMTVTASPACSSPYVVTATYPVTVQYVPASPQFNSSVQPTCLAPTGTIVLKGLPNRSDYVITQTGTSSNTYTGGTGSDLTTYTITGLIPGAYNFTVQYPGSCSSAALQNITINSLVTNTYTAAGGWSAGTPTMDQNIIFADNFSSAGDLTSCTCHINAGISVTINALNTLTITNGLVVDPSTGTLLTFKNNSSLVQVNNVTNSGSIAYERITTPIFQKDYVYWSTPVNPQKLVDVSPLTTSTKYYGNDGTQWVMTDRQSNMVVGKGYIIRGPDTYNNSTKQTYTALFNGVPNNGNLQGELLAAGNYYLVGNPYPSALSADVLISQNSILNGTIYFWTHNTPAKPTPTQQYTTDDYASYNQSGGVSAKSDPGHNNNPALDNGIKPTGKIAAGQAFYVNALSGGKVNFNNSMRLGGTNNSQFFKTENSSKETVLEKHRIWLDMTNANGVFKQLLVAYIEGATNDYDVRYDGISLDANPYLDFYSIANENKYIIQGRALPFTNSDLVPLGYRTIIAGDFTISIDEVDGDMTTQAIYIEDKVTGVIHDLRASNYTFTTAVGTFTDRLVLRYTNTTLGTKDFENQENGILVSVKNKMINIISSKENIKEVNIFDITGKQLYNTKKVENTKLQIQDLPSSNQVLIVKVILENDFTATRKIVF